jgi:hypothetical protein
MELFNELNAFRERAIEDFLTFIPIYESRLRTRRLKSFLKNQKQLISGKTCVEAGAGRGIFAGEMVKLGARKVFAVEQSPSMFQILEEEFGKHMKISLVNSPIEKFLPAGNIDTLVHEFYGPLVLDETILSLQRLKFSPENILPDGGRLWAMPVTEKQIRQKDKVYDPAWKKVLSSALVSDVFPGIPFRPVWEVFSWDVFRGGKTFEFVLPQSCDWIALCGEITHEGNSVLKLWQTGNWPVLFTPVSGKKFRLSFRYSGGFTKVYFGWTG